jgi:transposase
MAVIDDSGAVLDQRRLYHDDKDALAQYLDQWPGPVAVALEATRSWYWLYELLEQHAERVVLSHPAKTRLVAEAKVKTDKVDAEALAQLLRTDFLPQSYVPPRSVRDQRELHRWRVVVVALRTKLKNRVHAILDKLGIEQSLSDLFGRRGREFLDGLSLRGPYELELRSCLRLIDAIGAEEHSVTVEIRRVLKEDPRAGLLMSVPGIGEIWAYLILCEVGEIERFRSAKHFASYCALTPRTRQSAEHFWQGGTDRRGNLYLKWALVEAAHVAHTKDPALGALYASKSRTKGAGKAAVIVAHKLAIAVYQVLSRGENYRYNALTRRHLGKPEAALGRQ